uniref:Anaphase-promoting complex subunit 10 n=1 Tax=Amphiprion percula TaxID=161767 RepID=A0A3P8S4M9_AMPPE
MLKSIRSLIRTSLYLRRGLPTGFVPSFRTLRRICRGRRDLGILCTCPDHRRWLNFSCDDKGWELVISNKVSFVILSFHVTPRTADSLCERHSIGLLGVGMLPVGVGSQAVWSLSSCKLGFEVVQLRDNNLETYWKSQPHLVNIQFRRRTTVKMLCIYADYKSEESYTPKNRPPCLHISTFRYLFLLSIHNKVLEVTT